MAVAVVAGWIVGAKLTEAATSTTSSTLWLPALLTTAALGFLIFALPYAAIRVVELERDGRLDQIRITGLSPSALLGTLAMPGLPWLVAGLLFLIASAFLGNADHPEFGAAPILPWGRITVLVMASGLGAMLIMAMARVLRQVDVLLLMIAGGVLAALVAMATANAALAWPDALTADLALAAVIIVELALLAVFTRRAMLTLARPRAASGGIRARRQLEWSAMPPALRRGMATTLSPAVVLAAMALVGLAVRRLSPVADPANHADVAYVSLGFILAVGALVVSSIVRTDVDSGRFEVLRLSARTSIASACAMTLDLWLPFLIVTGLTAVAARALLGAPEAPGLAALALILLFVAPIAVLEGSHQAVMLTYTMPATLAITGLMRGPAAFSLVDTLSYLAVVWIPYVVLAERIRRGASAPVSPVVAAGAVAGVTFAAQGASFEPPTSLLRGPTPVGAFVLLVTVAWFDGREDWRHRWRLTAIVFAVAAAIALGLGYTARDAALIACLPAAAMVAGLAINQRLPSPVWSLIARMLAGLTIITWNTALFAPMLSLILGPPPVGGLRDAGLRLTVMRLTIAGTLMALAGVTGAILLALAIVKRAWPRRLTATLPP